MLNKRVIILFAIITAAITSGFAQSGQKMSITVKKAQIRTAPSFLGKIIYNLEYADRVEVYEEKKGWYFVGSAQQSEKGWIHSSALVKKKIVLKATNADLESSASGSEVALAGKGFNKQVEAEYKNQNDMDYTWVDKMETFGIENELIIAFLKEGEIAPKEAN